VRSLDEVSPAYRESVVALFAMLKVGCHASDRARDNCHLQKVFQVRRRGVETSARDATYKGFSCVVELLVIQF
jgi:hypothetical protein